MSKKKLIILGSTGSIGKSALDIVRRNPEMFEVLALTANSNLELIREQIEEFSVKHVALNSKDAANKLIKSNVSCNVLVGEDGIAELASMNSDVVVVGIIGLAALKPIMACIDKTKRIVLANKEAVLSAGELLMDKINKSSTELFPVDSEAWGVYRLMKLASDREIKNVYITASGGPFFFKDRSQMEDATVEQVLNHPVWDMGARITVDSASFMNKGFEVIEIFRVFGIDLDKIKVLVHPQSAVHALLETTDGAVFSTMFSADMRIPIGYGMCYPENCGFEKELDLSAMEKLEFHQPDDQAFPSLKLAYEVARKGGNLPTVLSTADEVAVEFFLQGKIAFLDIYRIVKDTLSFVEFAKLKTIDDVYYWDNWTRKYVAGLIEERFNI